MRDARESHDVDLDHGLTPPIAVLKHPVIAEACVVDEDVRLFGQGAEFPEEAGDVREVAQVHGETVDGEALPGNLLRQRGEAVGAAGGEDQAAAARGASWRANSAPNPEDAPVIRTVV